ncbi:MAG: hypothetical protein J2P38_10205 [Candidatus Dormibacteraeota bacterium]|nr:hypothetical protein [Candidatus Dormibacteraeota bacterium]
MARGDRVLVVMDVGAGQTQEFSVAATQAGRRVEVNTGSRQTTVSEVTRTGRPVRSAWFLTSRVVALIELPREAPRRTEPVQQLQLPVEGQGSGPPPAEQGSRA